MEVMTVESLKLAVHTVIPKSAGGTCCWGWPCEHVPRGFAKWATVAEKVQVCRGQGGVLGMR